MIVHMPPEYPEFMKYESIASVTTPHELTPDMLRDCKVFEKIDGENCQVRKYAPWQVIGGSRANYLTGPVLGRRPWFSDFNAWIRTNESIYNLPEGVILFGEWVTDEHQKVGQIRYGEKAANKFFLLDLLDLKSKRFIDYEEARELLDEKEISGIEYLDVLAKGKLTPAEIQRIVEEPSKIYSGEKEGIVIKNYNQKKQTFMKVYHPKHTEKLQTGETVSYLTPARFSKATRRILNSRSEISYDLLIEEVIRDVIKEEGRMYRKDEVKRELGILIKSGSLDDITKHLK